MNKNGGPAFPLIHSESMKTLIEQGGITVRDYFAAKAMQAFISNEKISKGPWLTEHLPKIFSHTAKAAYDMADAMLANRNKGE